MLLEFGAKNFFSFKEKFEVSLRLNASCPEKISHNKKYTNILAVKGANASGKTNVLKLLSFLSFMVLHSFSSKVSEKIDFSSYFDNTEATEIFIVFLGNQTEYRYEIKLTKEKILSETIYRKKGRNSTVIERKNNKITSNTINEFSSLKVMKLRDNASLVSTALQYEISEIDIIADFFMNLFIPNVSNIGLHDGMMTHKEISEIYFNDKSLFKFVTKVLKDSDTGISEIKILPKEDEETGKIEYIPAFYYRVNEDKKVLSFYDQSSGVKSLYIQLGYYKTVLDVAGVLVLDEFDINLHPDLLPMLIDFFEDEKKNKNNAQLIFTTHNSDIMDELGKYRVVLVNKEENESFLYRLDEIPGDILDGNMLRNDRSISSVYNAGKIGGKPKINYE